MINVDEIFRKLHEGTPLEEYEIEFLLILLEDYDKIICIANELSKQEFYYRRLASIRKYKK